MKYDPIPLQRPASSPELIELAKALARLAVKRDIAAARKDRIGANPPIRPLQ